MQTLTGTLKKVSQSPKEGAGTFTSREIRYITIFMD
jgi:hypothetical protein